MEYKIKRTKRLSQVRIVRQLKSDGWGRCGIMYVGNTMLYVCYVVVNTFGPGCRPNGSWWADKIPESANKAQGQRKALPDSVDCFEINRILNATAG